MTDTLKFGAQYDDADKWHEPDDRPTGVEFDFRQDGSLDLTVGDQWEALGVVLTPDEVTKLCAYLEARK